MGQERTVGTMWNARTSSCLVIPTLLYLHKQARAQKTIFVYLALVAWDFARCMECVFGF